MDQRQELPEGRPYRSHKFPACTACRHRKGRCHVEDPTQPCRYCRQRSLACDHGVGANAPRGHRKHTQRNSQRPRTGAISDAPAENSLLPQISFDDMQTPSESSPVMVDPTMADDIDVLERHLASRNVSDSPVAQRYVRISGSPGESIVYRTVPRLRKGLQSTTEPGVTQREIIENVLGALTVHVIQLYVDLAFINEKPKPSNVTMQILRQGQSVFSHSGRGIILEAMEEGPQAYFFDLDVRHLCSRYTLLGVFRTLAWSYSSKCPIRLEPGRTSFER